MNVTTLAELLGLACLILGGFFISIPAGIVAVGAALLYEARS